MQLEWKLEKDPPGEFQQRNPTVLCVDGEPIGKIALHMQFFYPVTVDSRTSAQMFTAFDAAKQALEDHATGRIKLFDPVISVPVQLR